MSSRRSGLPPQSNKIFALAALIGVSLSLVGCVNNTTQSSSQSMPDILSSGDNISSSYSEESRSGPSSEDYSSYFAESSSEFSSAESSYVSSSVTSSANPSESSSSYGSSESYSSFFSSSSVTPSRSSSEKSSPSSSSKTPQSVPIPNFDVPSSPGSAVISGSSAVIDYSNASNGYVSVKYTGSRSKVKFRYSCGDSQYTFTLSKKGSFEYFPLSCGSGTYTFYVFENIEGNVYSTSLQQTADISIVNNTKPYTYANQYVDYTKNSQCVAKAAELCVGKTASIDKISAIFLYISENITYDYQLAATVKSGYVPNPDKTLANKKGICFDYASLMAAMLRSQGIPTRLVVGYAKTDIYHAWNEVYTEQTGWITPELLMNNRGYNIADATFYASASDKKSISDYIMNSTNYTAVYYY